MNIYNPEFFEQKQFESLNYNQVSKALDRHEVIEAKVIKCTANNDLVVDIGENITGIIRFNEIEYHPDNSPIKPVASTSKVGKHVKFYVNEIEDNKDGTYTAYCSRKELQKSCYENYISKLVPGDVIDAYFVKATGYGAFCDIGCGIIAFLYANNISVTHVIDPVVEMAATTKMKVVVKSIDSKTLRVELTHKELLGTWEEEASNFSEGDVILGTVLSVEEYGTFIRIGQNISGLSDNKYKVDINTGDVVSVRVVKINRHNMKIKLNIIDRIDNDKENNKFKFRYRNIPKHIDKWVYSIPESKKVVESRFDA